MRRPKTPTAAEIIINIGTQERTDELERLYRNRLGAVHTKRKSSLVRKSARDKVPNWGPKLDNSYGAQWRGSRPGLREGQGKGLEVGAWLMMRNRGGKSTSENEDSEAEVEGGELEDLVGGDHVVDYSDGRLDSGFISRGGNYPKVDGYEEKRFDTENSQNGPAKGSVVTDLPSESEYTGVGNRMGLGNLDLGSTEVGIGNSVQTTPKVADMKTGR